MIAQLLTLGLTFCPSSALAYPPTAADRGALLRLAAENDEAWSAKDTKRILSQYATSGTLQVGPTAPLHVGREAVGKFFVGAFERRPVGFRHVTEVQHISMVSADVAVADSHVRVERQENGAWGLVRQFRNTSTAVREAGEWKLHSVRATPLP